MNKKTKVWMPINMDEVIIFHSLKLFSQRLGIKNMAKMFVKSFNIQLNLIGKGLQKEDNLSKIFDNKKIR